MNEAAREPFTGIGKLEPLVGNLTGYWSRHIDDTHRRACRASDDDLTVVSCRYHYGASTVSASPSYRLIPDGKNPPPLTGG